MLCRRPFTVKDNETGSVLSTGDVYIDTGGIYTTVLDEDATRNVRTVDTQNRLFFFT